MTTKSKIRKLRNEITEKEIKPIESNAKPVIRITKLAVLAELDDGTVRQILIHDKEQPVLLQLLVGMQGKIQIIPDELSITIAKIHENG